MDATANDVSPLFDVRGFPTLYWLPKDNKSKPIRYEVLMLLYILIQDKIITNCIILQGGRDVNDFIKYISSKATNELKNYDRSGNVKDVKNEL